MPLWVSAQKDVNAEPSTSEIADTSATIDTLLDQGMEFLYTDPEKSRELFSRAEDLAESTNDLLTQAEVCQTLSIYYWARGQFKEALQCDRKAIKLYQTLDDKHGLAYALNGLGVSLSDMGLNHEALKNYLEAERILTELQDSSGMQMVFLNLGVIFDNMRDYEASMEQYNRALEVGKNLDDPVVVGDIYNNKAEICLKLKNYDEAFDLYSKAFKIYTSENDFAGIILIKGNLAEYYRQIENYPVAEDLYIEALQGYQKMEDTHGECEIRLGIGKLYADSESFKKSENQLNLALKLAKKQQYPEMITRIQRQLSQVMYSQKQYEQAYLYYQDYDRAKDSLYRDSRSREFDNLRMAYEAEDKERQLEMLRSEREKEQIINEQKDRLRNALLIIAILLAAFSIFGILMYIRLKAVNANLESHQKSLEEKNREIEETAEQLKVANARLFNEKKAAEISSEAKAEFVSVLSHEIRTPLNAIVGISHAMREEITDPNQFEYINALLHSADTLLGFTNNILDLSRLDAGKLEINEETFTLRPLFKQIIRTFETALEEKQLYLNTDIEDSVPQLIKGDKMRLTQILLNLISNAVKYTDTGGINVKIKAGEQEENHTWLHIAVEDTGTGISKELQPKIFDRYSRLQYESTLTPQGSGLGLSITKSLIDLLGGSIHFKSEEGKGTTFKVALKFIPVKEDEHAADGLSQSNPGFNGKDSSPNLTGKSILLVEDNEVNIMFTERLLKKLNVEVEVARDGEESVSMTIDRDFDLILMDLQMPKLNGMDAAKAILNAKPDTKIIALTANSDQQLNIKLKKIGFKDLLIKPFKPEQLGECIGYWVNH